MGWLKRRLPRKKWKRLLLYVASTLLILLAADMLWVRSWRHITISPETTAITMPLSLSGFPDYVTALNDHYSRGVTLENNAAPFLLKVTGTEQLDPQWRAQVLPTLGMNPDPALPSLIEDFYLWGPKLPPSEKLDEVDLDNQDSEMGLHPWKGADHPLWVKWLDLQQPGLNLARTATNLPRFYVPWGLPKQQVGEFGGLFPRPNSTSTAPAISGFQSRVEIAGPQRRLFNVLKADAMRRAGESDWPMFRADVIAILRESRLVAQGPSLMDRLVAVALEAMGSLEIAHVAATDTIPLEEARQLQTDIAALPPPAPLEESTDLLQRWTKLDNIACTSAVGIDRLHCFQIWQQLFERGQITLVPPEPTLAWRSASLTIPVNYDSALRHANRAFDAMIEALRLKGYRARLDSVIATMNTYPAPQQTMSAWIAHPEIELLDDPFHGYNHIVILDQRAHTQLDMATITLALTIYRQEKGAYPEKLDDLTTAGIMKTVPLDAFSGIPFVYRRKDAGYILYTVGDNGGTDDDSKEPRWRVIRAER